MVSSADLAILNDGYLLDFSFFLMSYAEERPRWPIQSPNKGRKENKGRKKKTSLGTLKRPPVGTKQLPCQLRLPTVAYGDEDAGL